MSEIELSVTGSIARLQFNRPDVFNALSPNLLEGLISRCDELAPNESIKVVVLEGSGKHF